jgi:hypothetical protein
MPVPSAVPIEESVRFLARDVEEVRAKIAELKLASDTPGVSWPTADKPARSLPAF